MHRELLAGEDDLEDAQWVVAVEPGPAALVLDDEALVAAGRAPRRLGGAHPLMAGGPWSVVRASG